MGLSYSSIYIGRGTTIELACESLERQLKRHVSAKAFVKLEEEGKVFSPRGVPRIAHASLGNGSSTGIRIYFTKEPLEETGIDEFTATLTIKRIKKGRH